MSLITRFYRTQAMEEGKEVTVVGVVIVTLLEEDMVEHLLEGLEGKPRRLVHLDMQEEE
jgi:hypothetical protein